MNLLRLAAIFLTAVSLSLGLASVTQSQVAMRVDVDTTQISRHLLKSTVYLPAKPGEFAFRHPEWIPGIHGPSGQVRNIAGLNVFDSSGEKLQWRRDPEQLARFLVDVPHGDNVRVELVYLANQPTRISTGVDSFGNADVLAINMNTCIVYPDGADLRKLAVDSTVKLPADFKFASPLRGAVEVSDQKYAFATTSVETLVDSPLIAGRHYRKLDVEVSGFPDTRYHFVSESAKALKFDDDWAKYYDNLMVEAYLLFGSAPFKSYDFLVVCSDKLPGMGLEHHESSLNGIDEGALVDDDKKRGGAVYLLGHELVHAWCGKYRRPSGMYRSNYHTTKQTGELWIYEGLTQYLGQVLTARAGFLSFEEHKERVASRMGRLANRTGRSWRPLEDTAVAAYTLRGGSPSWTDLRRSQDYYDEGAFFWMEADSILRSKSDDRISLDDFCQQFFKYDPKYPKVKPFEVAEVVEILNDLVDYDWAGLIQRRIRSAAAEMSRDGLRAAGYDFVLLSEKPDYIRASEDARESISAQYSVGLAIKKQDGLISSVTPGSVADKAQLVNEMKIIGVNGMKFSTTRLEEAIEDSPRESRIELLVEEGDAYRVVILDYAEGPRYPALKKIEDQRDLLQQICRPKRTRD